MLKKILTISSKQGLFKLINRGKNMLIVESLLTGKRTPAYAHDKVVALGDISIYTNEGDTPLSEVLQKVADLEDGKAIDLKALANDAALREYFSKVLPEYDEDRVYASDIRKLLSWYNQLLQAGITMFSAEQPENTDEAAE